MKSADPIPLTSASAAASQVTMSQGGAAAAAIRWAGALTALAAASLLTGFFPALEARAHVVLALHAGLLLGCAAVLLSPAHGAVAVTDLARRAAEPARRTAAALGAPSGLLLRWLGFAGIALYVTGDVVATRKEATAETEAEADTVKAFLLFLMFLAGVSALYLSMIRERGGPPRPRPPATAAASLDKAGVWAVYLPTVAMDTGKGGPLPQPPAPGAAAEEDDDGGEVNGMTPRPVSVVLLIQSSDNGCGGKTKKAST